MSTTPRPPAGSYHAGLLGAGIRGSFSPALHEHEAAALGIPGRYELLDLDELAAGPADLGALIAGARAAGWQGLYVTHPCKQAVIPHLDALAPDAAAIGAVNTIVFGPDLAVGHNTDWSGFARGLDVGFPRGLDEQDLAEVVLLGAGGAGSAVGHALLTRGVRRLHVVDRLDERSAGLTRTLAARFPGRAVEHAGLGALADLLPRATGLVQATPVGMTGHPGTPVPARLLHAGLWVADVVNRPLRTELLAAARALGCRTLDGGPMLVLQAADGIALLTGHRPDDDRMLADFHRIVAAGDRHGG
ncbi:shikimate dehydrogenase [Amycolatopsis sp. WQ 127309]|uniref:shikimate dehydrogenase n=1 Tax=Amycolatopsis sp. WQ 127309 TaxID=2932773 RepID=UPI001FF6E7BD|nr:shikimate dehydrogenase [Amycolatopsis sp. WQ 127309]UOZ02758.1 shikimate dehydrogenase [Amycolatopsis sp. WQ 127309]